MSAPLSPETGLRGDPKPGPDATSGKSLSVGAGILASRLFGLARDRLLAHYLGAGLSRDLFELVFRGANVLQNLLGEQALSAAFLPQYVRLQGRERRGTHQKHDAGEGAESGLARSFALTVLGLLVGVAVLLVTLLWLLAPLLAPILAPGYWLEAPERLPALVKGLRLALPMTGLLVLSAWCLTLLNASGRFFLSYVAPVAWNIGIMAALAWAAWSAPAAKGPGDQLVYAACAGGVVGALGQFLVQFAPALRTLGRGPLPKVPRVELAKLFRAAGPAFLGRGSVQINNYLEMSMANLLAVGSLGILGYANRIYLLASTLVATTIVVVELPTLSRLWAEVERDSARLPEAIDRLRRAVAETCFLTVPCGVGFLILGREIIAAFFQTGAFGSSQAQLVGWVLAILGLALTPSTISRLLQNQYFARGDTRTPMLGGWIRLAVFGLLGLALSQRLDRFAWGGSLGNGIVQAGEDQLTLGAAGLALGTLCGALVEVVFLVLRAGVGDRRGSVLPGTRLALFTVLASLAALPVVGVARLLPDFTPWLRGPILVGLFAGVYLGVAALLGLGELRAVLRRWRLDRFLPRRGSA